MKQEGKVGGYVRYGRNLVESGVSGLRDGGESYLQGRPLSGSLSESARDSLNLAVIGVGMGLLPLCLGVRHRCVSRVMALGAAGAAIAFLAAFTWKSRQLTGSMMKAARKQIGAARDEHWLEGHPIDYA